MRKIRFFPIKAPGTYAGQDTGNTAKKHTSEHISRIMSQKIAT